MISSLMALVFAALDVWSFFGLWCWRFAVGFLVFGGWLFVGGAWYILKSWSFVPRTTFLVLQLVLSVSQPFSIDISLRSEL